MEAWPQLAVGELWAVKPGLPHRQIRVLLPNTPAHATCLWGPFTALYPFWRDNLAQNPYFFEISKYTALGVKGIAYQPNTSKQGFLGLIETLGFSLTLVTTTETT